jgi:hypothetical protein
MMRDRPETIDELMLDRHLGQLDAEQTERLEQALAAERGAAARDRALGEVLSLLDAYEPPEPPGDLADRVVRRVEEQTAVLPFKEPVSAVPMSSAHDLSASPVLSLRELIAIAACITLFVGVFVPGYFKAQRIAAQNACRENLRQIGYGAHAYAQSHAGFLPWVGYEPKANWLPTRTANIRRYSNTRPMFLLLQLGFIRDNDPRVFNCPADPHARPMIADDYREFSDFPEPANVSYSFLFMNTPEGRKVEDRGPASHMVMIADRNPLFDSRAAGERINPYSELSNSFAHGDGVGQNAIYVGGRGGWFTEPTIGVNGDNIYRFGQMVHYQGNEEPVSDTDTMLIP